MQRQQPKPPRAVPVEKGKSVRTAVLMLIEWFESGSRKTDAPQEITASDTSEKTSVPRRYPRP